MQEGEILNLALENQSFTVNLRHRFHEIPELGWQEKETISLIKKEIGKLAKTSKVPLKLVEKKGGLWVDLNFHVKRDRLLYRADIDALPIEEQTNLPFSSKYEGKMHACGHDTHTAMLLGALKVFCSGKLKPFYNLRLVWQRAEEVVTIQSGGSKLIEEGVLEGITYCYGLHISSTEEYGTFTSRPGCMMCHADQLQIKVTCSGGHVMHPKLGSNAIDIMTDIHAALRGFELRMLGPNEMISFVPSISHAGTACNIRPDRGEIWYAVRNFLTEKRLDAFITSIQEQIELIIQGYPSASLGKFIYYPGYPTLINDVKNYEFVKKLLTKARIKTATIPHLFSGEDFSYYLLNRVGSYWILGAKAGEQADHHTGKFNPDESVLWKGIVFWLSLACNRHPSHSKNEKKST